MGHERTTAYSHPMINENDIQPSLIKLPKRYEWKCKDCFYLGRLSLFDMYIHLDTDNWIASKIVAVSEHKEIVSHFWNHASSIGEAGMFKFISILCAAQSNPEMSSKLRSIFD